MMLKILKFMPMLLRAFVLTTSVEDFWNGRFPALCCIRSVVHMVSERKTLSPFFFFFTRKTSVICPVPPPPPPPQKKKKKKNPSLRDYRPIALASIAIKCFKHIVPHQLVKHTKPHLDPYQFAYKHNKNTEDATLLCTMHILILKFPVDLFEFSSSTFLLPSIPCNHTWWHANFWNSTLSPG